MKIRIVQFIWYSILNKIIKPGKPDPENPVLGELKKMYYQVKFYAIFFFKIVWLGDSNTQGGSKYSIMIRFKLLTINLGRGGAYCHHWLIALATKIGQKLYKLIKNKVVILNLGGNYMIKNEMGIAREGLKEMREKFPVSYMVNVPPIHANILAEIFKRIPDFPYKTAKEINEQVYILNKYIQEFWGNKIPILNQVINIHDILDNEEDIKIWWFALADIVHFNDKAYKHVYVKIVNAIVTILQELKIIK